MGSRKQHEPVRSCVVCREQAAKDALLKLVLEAEDRQLRYDQAGKAVGRGAYVCPREECLSQLEKGRAAGKLGGRITPELMKDLRAVLGLKGGQQG
jgi:predicted RNA-binding protein YlxR (DUF448 family)